MFGAMFDWKWPSGSEEEDFKRLTMYFLEIHYNLPVEKDVAHHLTNLNPLQSKMIYDCFKLVQWFFKTWINMYFYYVAFTLHVNKLKFPLPIVASCQFQLKLFWSKRMSNNNETCFNHFALIPLNVGFVLHL